MKCCIMMTVLVFFWCLVTIRVSVWKIWFYRVHNLNGREFQQKPNKKVNKREKEKRTTSLVFILFCIIFVSLSKCVQNLPLNRKKGIPQTQKQKHTRTFQWFFSSKIHSIFGVVPFNTWDFGDDIKPQKLTACTALLFVDSLAIQSLMAFLESLQLSGCCFYASGFWPIKSYEWTKFNDASARKRGKKSK